MIESFEEMAEIHAPAAFCYDFYRYLERFPSYLGNIKSVRYLDNNVWEWIFLGKYGNESRWKLRIDKDERALAIRWKSVAEPDEDIPIGLRINVCFTERGEENALMTTELQLETPDVPLSRMFQDLFGVSRNDLHQCILNFKTMLETEYRQSQKESTGRGVPGSQRDAEESRSGIQTRNELLNK